VIGRLFALVRDLRIRHHHQVAQAAGAATLAAQQRQDWPAATRHFADMHAAQARRDRLLQQHGPLCGLCRHVR